MSWSWGLGKIQKPIVLQEVTAGDGLLIVEYSEMGVKVKSLTSHFSGIILKNGVMLQDLARIGQISV